MGRDWSYDREGGSDGGGTERWLVTYADLITLLLVFFIVMYALSSRISQETFDELSQSLSVSLKKTTASPKPADEKGFLPTDSRETRKFKANATKVIQALVETDPKSEVKVDVDERGMVVSLIDTSFFDSGTATVKPAAVPVLMKMAQTFKSMDNDIRIEGHTDSVPIKTARFPTNWELSSSRATAVVRFLSERAGIPKHRLHAVGYADTKPVGSNGTWEGRKRNRRVEIVLMRAEDASPVGAGIPASVPAAAPPPPKPAAPRGGGFFNPFGQN